MAKTIAIIFIVCFGIVIYFIPTEVAIYRDKKNYMAISILNLFLGWTLVGWVVALVWAATED